MSLVARVKLWGSTIGAVAMVEGRDYASFQYDPDFQGSAIEVAPLMLPLSNRIWTFPALPLSFHGLPGLLSDSLPDRYGNALIDAWLTRQGRTPASFTPVERLCYTGSRGMGALTFEPAQGPQTSSGPVDIGALVALASQVLSSRDSLQGRLDDGDATVGLEDLLRVGTSAGGARAKAVIAWNPDTGEVRSGQLDADEGFGHWLVKFDGVTRSGDHGLADPQGYCVIEYAYSLLAKAAGIDMAECRLMNEGGRRHFMTRRFDRVGTARRHMQSLAAMAHLDYNQPRVHSYEQALDVVRRIGLGIDSVEQQYRRMVFNIVARNQDDHVKNIAFLMDQSGQWSLSPAYDLTYSYNPAGRWTSQHQMSVNGKTDGFDLTDLRSVAETASMARARADEIIEQVVSVVRCSNEYADQAGVPSERWAEVSRHHRLAFGKIG